METKKTIISLSLDDLPSVAQELISEITHPLVLLVGDLGAGKTTLVKALLRQLGSSDLGSSPSYSLVNEYNLSEGKLYHLDLYRLNSVEEVFALGIEDILYSGHYCMVEWPQLILDYLEPPYHLIRISTELSGHRKIELLG